MPGHPHKASTNVPCELMYFDSIQDYYFPTESLKMKGNYVGEIESKATRKKRHEQTKY